MFEIFSTREIVGIFYIVLFCVYVLSKKQLRKALVQVIKCACKIKLVVPFLLLIGYAGIIVYISTSVPFWNNTYIKDVIMWVLFVGIPYCYNATSDGEKEHYFSNLFKQNIKFIVILEFFVGTFTFSIVAELILQLIITFLVLLQAVSTTKEEWEATARLLDVMLAIIGFIILGFTIKAAMGNYQEVNPIDVIVSFLIPIIFSVLFIPCAYLLALYAKYETVYMRMGFKEPKDKKVRFTRYLKVFLTCGLSYEKLCYFHKEYVKRIYATMKESEFEEVLDELKFRVNKKRGKYE